MKLRWGICTAGKVSNDFVLALSLLPSEDHTVVAVAARSEENAKTFAEKHKIPKSYGNYETLATDANVDIVYIGSWVHQHLPLSKLFLGHGKNVLCEKPLALNKREVQEIVDLAKENDVFFMEGWWSRFFPAYVKLRELVAAGHIGEIKSINASFGLPFRMMERTRLKEYGGGSVMDMGVYLIQITLMIFGDEAPISWSTKGFLTETGVDETTVTTMLFPNNAVASLTCSLAVTLPNEMVVTGSRGHIKIPAPFWCPLKFEAITAVPRSEDILDLEVKSEVMEFPLTTVEGFNYPNSAGFQYEAEAVRQCLMKGLKECPIVSHKESLLVAQILQDARHDVGYLLDADMAHATAMPSQ